MVLPSDANFFNIKHTDIDWKESKPLVGSSKNKQLGYWISSIPIFTLFFSPPDTPRYLSSPTIVSLTLIKPINKYLEFIIKNLCFLI